QLAIRLDNPNYSARWYPGGGLYRNVWLTKTNKVHVSHWGTTVSTSNVSKDSAKIDLEVKVENNSDSNSNISVLTKIYEFNNDQIQAHIATIDQKNISISAGGRSEERRGGGGGGPP